jgi:putative metalloenzyme radical SAM/SPASM domain maturase
VSDSTGKAGLRPYPSRLFVETTTRCNLGCTMCVKQAGEHGLVDGSITAQTFARLEEAFPRLEALILNGVGEPLLHPQLEEFVRRGRSLMPASGWIGFQTNGLLLDEARAVSLVRAGLDRICISIDSVNPDTFRQVREGGTVGAIERALSALGAARSAYPSSRLEIGIEFVVMRRNIRELPTVLQWAARRGATFALVTQVVAYDESHLDQVAYDACTDAAVAIFEKWKRVAESEHVDLRRYTAVAWKYARTADEQRVVSLVNRMNEDAGSQGVFVDLEKLLARDEAWFAEAEEIFAEARSTAETLGMRLELPELIPREERRCDFVEGGGAFVSWEGEVHPCYFLWHRYRCHIQGWKQSVQPKSFGNVTGGGIMAIWNGEEFRRFRESVLGFDYPLCFSCKLAPCDYVEAENFEQDCHIRHEPCGSCLWCMGIFRCLQ